jgi:hypothetical protein
MLDTGYWMLDAGGNVAEIPYHRLKGDDREYWIGDAGCHPRAGGDPLVSSVLMYNSLDSSFRGNDNEVNAINLCFQKENMEK